MFSTELFALFISLCTRDQAERSVFSTFFFETMRLFTKMLVRWQGMRSPTIEICSFESRFLKYFFTWRNVGLF